MVYGFLQFSQWFIRAYPHSFISPLRINVSAIESIFSVLKFTAGGNLSLQATLDLFVEVITGREVITNSNLECGYHDGIILVSESFRIHQIAGPQEHTLRDWFMTFLV